MERRAGRRAAVRAVRVVRRRRRALRGHRARILEDSVPRRAAATSRPAASPQDQSRPAWQHSTALRRRRPRQASTANDLVDGTQPPDARRGGEARRGALARRVDADARRWTAADAALAGRRVVGLHQARPSLVHRAGRAAPAARPSRIGERTPLFRITDATATSALVVSAHRRPARRTIHPLAGVMRLEAPGTLPICRRRLALADQATLVLPRLASSPVRDPRAPQNLTPVGALESRAHAPPRRPPLDLAAADGAAIEAESGGSRYDERSRLNAASDGNAANGSTQASPHDRRARQRGHSPGRPRPRHPREAATPLGFWVYVDPSTRTSSSTMSCTCARRCRTAAGRGHRCLRRRRRGARDRRRACSFDSDVALGDARRAAGADRRRRARRGDARRARDVRAAACPASRSRARTAPRATRRSSSTRCTSRTAPTRRSPSGSRAPASPCTATSHFLNGVRGGHVNISGISGVATKTSYAMFLLYSPASRAARSATCARTPRAHRLQREGRGPALPRPAERRARRRATARTTRRIGLPAAAVPVECALRAGGPRAAAAPPTPARGCRASPASTGRSASSATSATCASSSPTPTPTSRCARYLVDIVEARLASRRAPTRRPASTVAHGRHRRRDRRRLRRPVDAIAKHDHPDEYDDSLAWAGHGGSAAPRHGARVPAPPRGRRAARRPPRARRRLTRTTPRTASTGRRRRSPSSTSTACTTAPSASSSASCSSACSRIARERQQRDPLASSSSSTS